MKIEGTFVANGGEEYLTFGYFEDSSSVSDTLNTQDDEFVAKSAYYFIDGVELVEVTDSIPEEVILIPNVLTPNDDGVNDIFELNFNFKKTSILNRWGNLIWSSANVEYWNGKSKEGKDVSEGTYFYIIETDSDKYQGFVQVIR